MRDKDVVMVFTSKSIETMIGEGGSGNWKANEKRLYRCRWVVAVRNRHSRRREGNEEHGSAFLIGRIAGLKPSANPDQPTRLVIAFDKYAQIDLPNSWRKGNRNPVAYTTLEELRIDPEKLRWKEIAANRRAAKHSEPKGHVERQAPAAVLEEAKQMIARFLSVAPSAVKISIEI